MITPEERVKIITDRIKSQPIPAKRSATLLPYDNLPDPTIRKKIRIQHSSNHTVRKTPISAPPSTDSASNIISDTESIDSKHDQPKLKLNDTSKNESIVLLDMPILDCDMVSEDLNVSSSSEEGELRESTTPTNRSSSANSNDNPDAKLACRTRTSTPTKKLLPTSNSDNNFHNNKNLVPAYEPKPFGTVNPPKYVPTRIERDPRQSRAPRTVPTQSVLFDLLRMVSSCDETVGIAMERAMIGQGYLKPRPRR